MRNKNITIYSCSGCSNVAQLANRIAVTLDRTNEAKMSCIAGIGAGVPHLINVAKNSEKIIALDGCPIHCAKKCLENQNINIDKHLTLTEFNIKKSDNEDVDESEYKKTLTKVKKILTSIS